MSPKNICVGYSQCSSDLNFPGWGRGWWGWGAHRVNAFRIPQGGIQGKK